MPIVSQIKNDYRKYLDPEVVARIKNMQLRARLVVEGFITGLHRSPYHGFSVEFSEYRQYMPGDEIRHIDWKVYGKTNRFYIKQFEEETNLKCYLLLDTSGSMGYSSQQISKLDYAASLAAALAYLMIEQRDAVGLIKFDQKISKYLPPRSIKSYLLQILKELANIRCSETTDVASTFHEMAERIHRRGLIIVLSDLYDEPESVISGLKHFRHKKHEVIVFHILDPMEINFNFNRTSRFKDMESGEEIDTQPWHIRPDYQKKVKQFIENYKRQCRLSQIDYVPLITSQPFDLALMEYLIKRKRIGG
ncbi:MAG: DUF58 domain-containing protein [candidate division KSB1 bacterium]|nr:DUF58 domain-containing protein [candidate division KSB1 bacterium]MDZ7336526.1 DUF58 domain-containing protein [candidate division KSB1 bacterium]MDZ7401821.1 DUF58 domain-containing protein [candidate division KSB1 bacterium]